MKLFNVNWKVKTAGPSPDDNYRTEVFLFGCNKAKSGNPCKGCFNSSLWDDSVVIKTHSPEEIADKLIEYSRNKYISIGGGEPTDQIEELITLCKILKRDNFHILVYTWKKLSDIIDGVYGLEFKENMLKLIRYIDILVDGEYKQEERTYQEDLGDGAFNSVGSANQIVWDINAFRYITWLQDTIPYISGMAMKDIDGLWLNPNRHNNLLYITKNEIEFEKCYLK